MGEIAEMMLDGTMCTSCGELLVGPSELGFDADEGAGFPTYCAGCAPDFEPKPRKMRRGPQDRDHISCKIAGCDRYLRTTSALKQHMRDKHGQ